MRSVEQRLSALEVLPARDDPVEFERVEPRDWPGLLLDASLAGGEVEVVMTERFGPSGLFL